MKKKEVRRISEEHLKGLENKGFKISVVNKTVSINYMLSTILKEYTLNLEDYLKEHKIKPMFSDELTRIYRSHEEFESRIRKLIIGEDIRTFFNDYDTLSALIEDFASVEEEDEKFMMLSISSCFGKPRVKIKSKSQKNLVNFIVNKMEESEDVKDLFLKVAEEFNRRSNENK